MGVKKLTGTESVEALVYDRVFMDNMTIIQNEITNNTQDPIYNIEISYRMYAVGSDETLHFKNQVTGVTLQDFFAFAMTKAGGGDLTYVEAMQAIEQVVAGIITEEQGVATQVL